MHRYHGAIDRVVVSKSWPRHYNFVTRLNLIVLGVQGQKIQSNGNTSAYRSNVLLMGWQRNWCRYGVSGGRLDEDRRKAVTRQECLPTQYLNAG